MAIDGPSKMRGARFGPRTYFRNRESGFRCVLARFTNTGYRGNATIGSKEGWSPYDIHGWIIVSPVLSSHEDFLTLSTAVLLQVP